MNWNQQKPSPDNVNRTSNRKKTSFRIALAALMLFIAVLGGIAWYAANALKPLQASKREVKIDIPQGTAPAKVADILEEKGVIRSSFMFQLYLKYRNEGSLFKAGTYGFYPGMTLDEIIAKLDNGDVLKEAVIRFTIPEGYTIEQIADVLQNKGIADRATFLKLADRQTKLPFKYASQLPVTGGMKHRLEGYLFPETYELKIGSTEQDILDRMVQELDRKMQQLPSGWDQQLSKLHLTFHQMMTIASLIEREVAVDEERPVVSGVIYNRIKAGMRLQIDATVQYALDKPKQRLINKDLQVDSPFNTYLHDGLPPGPIASPSLASIEAALYPQQTKYYYYVTKKDGSHEHWFAETYKQHQQNIEKSKG